MKKLLSLMLVISLLLTLAACSSSGGSDRDSGGACVDIELNKDTITFTKPGQTKGLNVKTEPRDTGDEVEFESDDEDVATVDEDGLVRAEGPGETTIIVRCGDEVAYCDIICDFDGGDITDPGSTDDPDPTDDPNPTDDPDPTDVPDNDCRTCGGRGVCPKCRGDYLCHECDGTGDCQRCDGKGRITCPSCDGELDECKYCGGDGGGGGGSSGSLTDPDYTYSPPLKCAACDGTGRYCEQCLWYGTILCPEGCKNGNCTECDGKRVTCTYCNKGACPDCG